jgi:Mce-associated membrane protein
MTDNEPDDRPDNRHDASSGPTLYDVLGVARTASAAAIRKAWRRRTDKAGPGSVEFARLNEAADTLLDPVRRAAYDATLPAPEPAPEPVAKAGRPALGWLVGLGLLGLATAAVVALAVVLSVRHHHQEQTDTARTEAPAAAERALPVVLGYDYRHLDADLRASTGYLSSSYRTSFERTFGLLKDGKDGQPGPAVQTKAVVTASVVGTAVMDADPDRVQVLAYVNQVSKHGSDAPSLFQNRVRVSMVKQGDSWLIDGLDPR